METSCAEVTVSVVEAKKLPEEAVISDVPVEVPHVAKPCIPGVLLIIATEGFVEFQVTNEVTSCGIELFDKVPVAMNCTGIPAATFGFDGVTATMDSSVAGGVFDPLPELPTLQPDARATIRTRFPMLFNFIDAHSSWD
jgi:hypothetical protein